MNDHAAEQAFGSWEERSATTSQDRPRATSIRSGLHVLLVEDGEVNRMIAILFLKHYGHSVGVAHDGLEALATFSRERFDLVLMDVEMPRMDGYQATSAIREMERIAGGHIPIIAMTAHASKGDREHCLSVGMDRYVSKPITAKRLSDAIQSVECLSVQHSRGLVSEHPYV